MWGEGDYHGRAFMVYYIVNHRDKVSFCTNVSTVSIPFYRGLIITLIKGIRIRKALRPEWIDRSLLCERLFFKCGDRDAEWQNSFTRELRGTAWVWWCFINKRCPDGEQPQDCQRVRSWRAEAAAGDRGVKAAFQRQLNNVQQQPESDVKELKLGHISSFRAGLREAVVREIAWTIWSQTILLRDLLVDEVLWCGASLTPQLPNRLKQVESPGSW